MDLLRDIIVGLFLAAGCFFLLVGSVGLVRMPDIFTRMHATSVSDTLGVGFLGIAMIIAAGPGLVAGKLVILLMLLALTGPVTSHALARAAMYDGMEPELDGPKLDATGETIVAADEAPSGGPAAAPAGKAKLPTTKKRTAKPKAAGKTPAKGKGKA